MISNTLPQSLIDNPILSQWIAFEEPGRVRVGSGKVEIGQGILTALTQIAAEELDVAVRAGAVSSPARPTSVRLRASPRAAIRSRWAALRSGWSAPRCARCSSIASRSSSAARSSELSIEDGQFLRAGKDNRPRLLVAGGRNRARTPRKRHRAGEAAIDLQDRRHAACRGSICPAKVAGAAFIHDIVPEGVVHARVLRQPWRGARLVELDESAVRKAAKAPIDILREGDFVAFTAASEIAVMRAAEAARTLARWEGGTPAPDDIGDAGLAEGAAVARPKTDGDRPARRAPPTGRVVEALYSRPFLTYGSIGPACALAEFKDGALKVWSHTQGPAVLRDWLARALGLAAAQVDGVPPPGRRRLRPQHRRRRRLRCLVHRHAACRARPSACNGRARTNSPARRSAPRWRSGCARRSMPTTGRRTGRSRSGARRTPSVPA